MTTYSDSEEQVYDSAEVVAHKLKWILEKENLLNPQKVNKDVFYVSDYTDFFELATKAFFGEAIHLEYLPIWDN